MASPRTDQPAPREAIRLILVDGHKMVAAAFGAVLALEPDLDLVATADTLASASRLVKRHRPDVLVCDLRLPDGMTTDHMDALTAQAGDVAVLIVTGAATEQGLVGALEAGVRGFLSKAQTLQDLLGAIRTVAAGGTVVSPDLIGALAGRVGTPSGSLTQREAEVLQHLADGNGTRQIAADLHLSPNTVRNHVSNLLDKLDVHSRLEAVSEATRRGLVVPSSPY